MEIVILGAGSHAQDVRYIAEAAGFTVSELFDDEAQGTRPLMAAWSTPARVGYLLGFNAPALRRRFDRQVRVAPAAVHPAAYIGPTCELAPGCVVAPSACLSNDVSLGRHVHVNAGSTLVRATVGDYSTIAPGVHVAGDVVIGSDVFVGIGARITNLVSIGNGATIGAGAVVLDDVPAGATVVGVPARQLEGAT